MGHNMFFGFGMFWWIIFILFVVYLFFQNKNISRFNHKTEKDPLQILKERFAKGEIDKEEFEEAKKMLEK